MNVTFTLNGRERTLDVPPHLTLLQVLRDTLGVFDAKEGCDEGVCGACAVVLDGAVVNSCSVFAVQADEAQVETVASLSNGELHPLQRALVDRGAVQCGFCTPGMVLGALEAVRLDLAGDRDSIRRALAGNLCRCTGYGRIVDAVEEYAAP